MKLKADFFIRQGLVARNMTQEFWMRTNRMARPFFIGIDPFHFRVANTNETVESEANVLYSSSHSNDGSIVQLKKNIKDLESLNGRLMFLMKEIQGLTRRL